MAIKFTPEYNARINKIVQNYNKRVMRANKLGKIKKSELPEIVSVKTLKKSFNRKADLERELKNLETFKRKSVRDKDGNVTGYDIQLIKTNRRAAIKYFEKQADIIRKKANGPYPLQKERLNAIEDNLAILKKGTAKASDADLKAMERYIDKYRKSFERQATGYRGFLNEVDLLMDRVGVDKQAKDQFFQKLSQLNSEEFYELYEKNDLINKIYEFADSPKTASKKTDSDQLEIHATNEEIQEKIGTLMSEVDLLIAEVKH